MKYWIIQRNNPQLKKPYYLALGKISAKEARKKETSIYGYNIALDYKSKKAYEEAIANFLNKGCSVSYR